MIKYEVIIYWSNEDKAFVAEVPELPGCAAHGATHSAALSNAPGCDWFMVRQREKVGRSDSGTQGATFGLCLIPTSSDADKLAT